MGWALALVATAPAVAIAAPPSHQAIIKACDEAESAVQCERLLETEQIKQVPAIATREGRVLRLKTRASSAPIELRDAGDPDGETGAEYRAHAFWDYWPQRKSAVVSVTTQAGDYYLVIDLDRGTQTRVPAEPLLAPDSLRFLVADLCEKQCANLIQIWRFERDRLVRERTFKPAEKWYEADVAWRDAATLAVEYSVAAPQPRRRLAEFGELVLVRARPRLLKLSDSGWSVDEIGR
jgi:hypothetical protein